MNDKRCCNLCGYTGPDYDLPCDGHRTANRFMYIEKDTTCCGWKVFLTGGKFGPSVSHCHRDTWEEAVAHAQKWLDNILATNNPHRSKFVITRNETWGQ
jgi:hypothetical protein